MVSLEVLEVGQIFRQFETQGMSEDLELDQLFREIFVCFSEFLQILFGELNSTVEND
jgi:hypothetical protein